MVVKGEEEAFPPLATYLLVAARNHLLKEIQSAEVYEPRTEAGMVGKRFFADSSGISPSWQHALPSVEVLLSPQQSSSFCHINLAFSIQRPLALWLYLRHWLWKYKVGLLVVANGLPWYRVSPSAAGRCGCAATHQLCKCTFMLTAFLPT